MEPPSLKSGIICTPEEYARNDGTIHCLSRGQSIGLTLVAETGFISLFAVIFVYIIIFRNLIRHIRCSPRHKVWHVIQQPADVLMLSLFAADWVQALGAILDIKWINDGKVEIGSFCTAQGVIQQLGETAVALTTLVIALHTFVGVWWRIGVKSTRGAYAIIGFVWTFVILFVIIGNAVHSDRSKLYQAPTPYWCWIGDDWLSIRIAGEYIWLWLTLGVSFVTYLLLFLWSRGNITLNEKSWWRFKFHRVRRGDAHDAHRRRNALSMIAYPIVYSILILPLSIIRWVGWQTHSIPSAATIAVIAIYGLSGFFNVVLLLLTRPNSILFGKGEYYDDDGRAPSVNSVAGPDPSESQRGLSNEEMNETREEGGGTGLDLGRLPSRSSDGGWDLPVRDHV